MISGDQLLPKISSNISLYPGAGSPDPLADFLASLEWQARAATGSAKTIVLPAHGQPFRGAADRAASCKAGHQRRLGQLSGVLTADRADAASHGRGAVRGAQPRGLEQPAGRWGDAGARAGYLHGRGGPARGSQTGAQSTGCAPRGRRAPYHIHLRACSGCCHERTNSLSRLLDEAALRRTAELYATGADRRDKALWGAIMTEDCVIEAPGIALKGARADRGRAGHHGAAVRLPPSTGSTTRSWPSMGTPPG